jgi:hypothetical protein
VRYTVFRPIYGRSSFLTRLRAQNGRILRHSRAMNGSAGLSPSRKWKAEGSTLSGYAWSLRKECVGLVAGQAALTAERLAHLSSVICALPKCGLPACHATCSSDVLFQVPFCFGWSLRSYPFAVSMPSGARPLVHPRSLPLDVYACGPSFPNRQESAGKSRATPPQTPPAARASASDFRTPSLAKPAKQISCRLHETPVAPRGNTLRRLLGSVQSCENLLVSWRHVGSSDHRQTAQVCRPDRVTQNARDNLAKDEFRYLPEPCPACGYEAHRK